MDTLRALADQVKDTFRRVPIAERVRERLRLEERAHIPGVGQPVQSRR